MRTVGIKQLKARLSEYVRAVRQGEAFLVTDRDVVVAELRPPGSSADFASKPSTAGEILASLTATGETAGPTAGREGWSWKTTGLGLATADVTRVLDEMRSDRDGAL